MSLMVVFVIKDVEVIHYVFFLIIGKNKILKANRKNKHFRYIKKLIKWMKKWEMKLTAYYNSPWNRCCHHHLLPPDRHPEPVNTWSRARWTVSQLVHTYHRFQIKNMSCVIFMNRSELYIYLVHTFSMCHPPTCHIYTFML